MACQSSRFSRLFGWRYLRWALALPALPLALWACNSHPLQQPAPLPQQETDILVSVNPVRMLDIVFMVDNSPSMQPKQDALAAAFPQMIDELKKLPDGLPDVHIAVVSSDLGAGRSSLAGNCSRVQGDRGLFKVKPDCGLNADALWLESVPGKTPNFSGDISTVFGCLATIGTEGCGYEHQLKSVAVSLQREEHKGFLRDEAYLAIVLISDEDDCSAPWDSPMFEASHAEETTSLRCATRGHICGGRSLAYPTSEPFETELLNCAAKENDTPLMKVSEIVQAVRDSKPRPAEQVIVAGIFGWPADEASVTDGSAKYRIGEDPSPMPGQEGKLDYLPICEVTGLGKNYAGIRLKAFVDAFGKDNGLMFPLCANDFKAPMQKIGEKLRRTLDNTCVDYPLIDTDRADGTQPTCSVVDRYPKGKTYEELKIPSCAANPNADPCWEITQAAPEDKCKLNQKVNVRRGPDGTDKAPPGTLVSMKCLTCALEDGNCAPQYKN